MHGATWDTKFQYIQNLISPMFTQVEGGGWAGHTYYCMIGEFICLPGMDPMTLIAAIGAPFSLPSSEQ